MKEQLYVTQVREAFVQIRGGSLDCFVEVPDYSAIDPVTDFGVLQSLIHVQSSTDAQVFIEPTHLALKNRSEGIYPFASSDSPLLFSAGGIIYRMFDTSSHQEGYLFVSRTDTPRLSVFAGRSSCIEEIFQPSLVGCREGLEEGLLVYDDRFILHQRLLAGGNYGRSLLKELNVSFNRTELKFSYDSSFFNPDVLRVFSGGNQVSEVSCVLSWDSSKAALDAIQVLYLDLDLSRLSIYDIEKDLEGKPLQRDHVFVPLSVLEAGEGDCIALNSFQGIREKRPYSVYRLGYTARNVLSRFHNIPYLK